MHGKPLKFFIKCRDVKTFSLCHILNVITGNINTFWREHKNIPGNLTHIAGNRENTSGNKVHNTLRLHNVNSFEIDNNRLTIHQHFTNLLGFSKIAWFDTTATPEAKALEREALKYDLHLLQARCKHLGTENNLKILTSIYEAIRGKHTFLFDTAVTSIEAKDGAYTLVTEGGERFTAPYLIAGPGRSGAEWFANQCKSLGLELLNNQVDIGVRVELPASVFEHITDVVYESKLIYRTKQYGDQVRTFCMNPYGHVVAENVEGINTVNGHSYSDPALQSENTNFALLVSNRFTSPFNEPYRYGKHVASLSNMLAGGVLVQRFGDLVGGRRTNDHRMSKSFVHPTLTAAIPGDLSLALPKRQLDDIIEMMYALDKLAPGAANYDTLLYGAEVKFYSARIKLSHELETALPGFFAVVVLWVV